MEETGEKKQKTFDSSESLSKLFTALCKAQFKMPHAKLNSRNPHFKSDYADLTSCLDAVRGPFYDEGLSIIQLPTQPFSDGYVSLKTILCHVSGEWISSTIHLKPARLDPQSYGSALSYARRYGLKSIAGISDEDDDANVSMPNKDLEKPKVIHQNHLVRKVTEPQLKRLFAITNKNSWKKEDVSKVLMEKFKLESSRDLNQDQYNSLVEIIENKQQTKKEVENVIVK